MKIALIHDAVRASASGPDVESQAKIIDEISRALGENNHDVFTAGCLNDIGGFLKKIKDFNPGIVFNLAESVFGDSSREHLMPAVLEAANFKYTGSGSEALLLCGDKFISKSILKNENIPVPGFKLISSPGAAEASDILFPVILKPSREHASLGIDESSVFYESSKKLISKIESMVKKFSQPLIMESFIDGREINLSLLGSENYTALPPAEIKFSGSARVVGYGAKWAPGSREYENTAPLCPAPLGAGLLKKILDISKKTASVLSCRGYTRIDLRLDENQNPFVIDVNPNPDLGKNSGLARSAAAGGLSYADLLEEIISTALKR